MTRLLMSAPNTSNVVTIFFSKTYLPEEDPLHDIFLQQWIDMLRGLSFGASIKCLILYVDKVFIHLGTILWKNFSIGALGTPSMHIQQREVMRHDLMLRV
jgi:hypothetical protein